MKTVGDIVDIKSLATQGLNKTQMARRLGMDRGTVAKYLWMAEVPDKLQRKPVARKIDDYMDYIQERLETFPELSAERLYREIVTHGYNGSPRTVRRYVERVVSVIRCHPGWQCAIPIPFPGASDMVFA